MTTPNPTEGPPLVPDYEPHERELLTSLRFFVGEITKLHDRGLIADDAYRTILEESEAHRESIERAGNYRAARANAVRLRSAEPLAALYWAEKAMALDSSTRESREFVIELLRKVGENEQALLICEVAATKFPDLSITPDKIRAEIASTAEIQRLLTDARDAIQILVDFLRHGC